MSAHPRAIQSVFSGRTAPVPYGPWIRDLDRLAGEYQRGEPVAHIRIPQFLQPHLALRMAQEFPHPDAGSWTRYRHYNENKLGMTDWKMFPASLRQAVVDLNSPLFASGMSVLTGIRGLFPDPGLDGGGLHLCMRGGYLNLHTDFSMHHYRKGLRRRVNLILYLNPLWDESWGGAIEFWERSRQHCVAKYAPHLNHAVIFNTEDRALHGFPDPLNCPANVFRKSLALYYYTMEPGASKARSTDYYARSSDGTAKRALVWLDKKAVDLYSKAKTRFKFSDKPASKILGFLSRRS